MDCRYKIVHSASRGAPWKPWTSTSSEGRCSVSFLQISPLNFCRRYLSANTVVTCNGLTAVISKLKNFGNVTVLPTVTNLNCNRFSNCHKTFHCNGFTNSHKILISNFVIQIWNISLKSRNLKFQAKSELLGEIWNFGWNLKPSLFSAGSGNTLLWVCDYA